MLKEEIYKNAMLLSPVDRAQLIEAILTSFSFKDREKIDEPWSVEVEDRIDAYEKGLVDKISFDDVFSSL